MATNTNSMIWYCTVHSKSSELGETGVFNSRLARNLNGNGRSVGFAVVCGTTWVGTRMCGAVNAVVQVEHAPATCR